MNSLNAKLNSICHFLALLEAHHILHVSRIRVKVTVIVISKRDGHLRSKYYVSEF